MSRWTGTVPTLSLRDNHGDKNSHRSKKIWQGSGRKYKPNAEAKNQHGNKGYFLQNWMQTSVVWKGAWRSHNSTSTAKLSPNECTNLSFGLSAKTTGKNKGDIGTNTTTKVLLRQRRKPAMQGKRMRPIVDPGGGGGRGGGRNESRTRWAQTPRFCHRISVRSY